MNTLNCLYIPVGVPTFHLESAARAFERSAALLRKLCPDTVCPGGVLLGMDELCAYLDGQTPDLIVFQNTTFANAEYMTEVLRRFPCPIALWTLREPVIDGGRLRLNSLTGAYSAANAIAAFRGGDFEYVFGSPEESAVRSALAAVIAAARVKKDLRGLRVSAIGHTPQGFGFGRGLDLELAGAFGVTLESIEARELIDNAKGFTDEECAQYLQKSERAMCGLEHTPEKNRLDYARLYKAYADYIGKNHIGALASRCWPDFFTAFGTPVCSVLSMLGDDGVAAACEADICGALSMWIGMRLSGSPTFFGDPVSLSEEENTITYWHCGASACSLARHDTGAVVGVHPNRKIGPAMDFGCEGFGRATVFRVGRKSDGSFRFFVAEGEALDKPKQFTGTSIVVRTDGNSRDIVEKSVRAGFEPHFVVIRGGYARELRALAHMLGLELFDA